MFLVARLTRIFYLYICFFKSLKRFYNLVVFIWLYLSYELLYRYFSNRF